MIEINQHKKSQVMTIVNIIQRKIGADLQKILKWMKTFGDNMKQHFGKIMNLEPRKNLKRMTLEKHFGMRAKKMLIQNPKRNTRIIKQMYLNMI